MDAVMTSIFFFGIGVATSALIGLFAVLYYSKFYIKDNVSITLIRFYSKKVQQLNAWALFVIFLPNLPYYPTTAKPIYVCFTGAPKLLKRF